MRGWLGSQLGLIAVLSTLLDAIAVLGLATTPEVGLPMLVTIAALFVLSRLIRVRLSDRLAVPVFVAILAGAFLYFWISRQVPLSIAANAAPLIQATIWFCGDTPRWRNWRLSISFLELVLAASMNPDLYLSMLILAFLAVAVFQLMLSYLDGWCARNGVGKPAIVARSMIGSSAAAVGLMIVCGAVIFPFLPRAAGQIHPLSNPQAQVGYTEDVNVSEWLKMSGEGGGDTLVRVFMPESAGEGRKNLEIADFLMGGLMRAKILDHFDGVSWTPSKSREVIRGAVRSPATLSEFQDEIVELIREPMMSSILPVPYGARSISLNNGTGVDLPQRANSEFLDDASYGKRVGYKVQLTFRHGGPPPAALPQDLPIADDLHVPKSLVTEPLKKVSRDLLGGRGTVEDRIQRLRTYFRRFSASVSGETLAIPRVPGHRELSTVEKFLFVEKQGHCELFSTAGAVLLRLAGIPTRMVAGFRTSHASSAGVLSLRQGDAHAWLEYWNPEMGWRVLDLTPRVLMPGSLLASLQDWYDQISGLWYQYVLSYESLSDLASSLKSSSYAQIKEKKVSEWSASLKESLFQNADLIIACAVAAGLLALIAYLIVRSWFPWVLSIRRRVRQGPPELSRERARMERWVFRQLNPWAWLWSDRRWATIEELRATVERRWGSAWAAEFQDWSTRYQRLRFGGKTRPSRDELRGLRESRRKFVSAVKEA